MNEDLLRQGDNKPVIRLAIEYVSVAALKPDSRNPRSHSKRQIRQIAQSIKAFGFNVPLLIDGDGTVIAGHGRLLATQQLGWTEVPVIRLEHLNEAQKRAFMIADNRLTENSEWHETLLAEQLQELSLLDLNFSLETTGFEIGEIDLMVEGLAERPSDKADPADALPAPIDRPASRPGDVWLAGRHRICCGDATERAAYMPLMDGAQADFMFTDPPYNVRIDGHATGLGAIHHREFAMASGEMTAAQFTAFLTSFCRLAGQHSRDGAIHDIFMDWRHLDELLAAGKQVYSELKNLCVWVKHNAGMGSFYRSQHEFVAVFKYGTKAHRNNIELGRHGRNRTNVWNYPGVNTLARSAEEGNGLLLHSTAKPVSLVADAILDCSARGDIVLDPFLGSGTSLIAAERTGRRCRGIELDPGYVDTAITRWQAFTGIVARHAITGKTFAEMEKARGHENE
jgi:DNA modification methylase